MLHLRNNGKEPILAHYAHHKIFIQPGQTVGPLKIIRNDMREILDPEVYGPFMEREWRNKGLILHDDDKAPLDSPAVRELDAQAFRRYVDWLRGQVRAFNSLNLAQANKGIELIPMPDSVKDCITMLQQIEGGVEGPGVVAGKELEDLAARTGPKSVELLNNIRQALLTGNVDDAMRFAKVDINAGADVSSTEEVLPVSSKVAKRRRAG